MDRKWLPLNLSEQKKANLSDTVFRQQFRNSRPMDAAGGVNEKK